MTTTIDYMLILSLSLVILAMGNHLYRRVKHSFLGDYFVLMVLGLIWGFVIWVMPELIQTLARPSKQAALISRSTILLLKWFAFPIQIFHAFTLTLFLGKMTGQSIPSKLKTAYFTLSLVLTLYLLIRLSMELPYGISEQLHKYTIATTYFFIALEMSVLLYFSLRMRKQTAPQRQLCGMFSLLSLFLYGIYLLLSSEYSPLGWLNVQPNAVIGKYSFFAIWFIPFALIFRHFNREHSPIPKQKIYPEDLLAILSPFQLTAREKEVAIHVFNGLSNQEIEDRLYLSRQTIKNYISSLYRKLGINNRLELIRFIRSKVEYP